MNIKKILLIATFILMLSGCKISNASTNTNISTTTTVNSTTSGVNTTTAKTTTDTSITTTQDAKEVKIESFNKDIKTTEVINPGMGFYRTRYVTLKRECEEQNYDFEDNGFYHVRIDLSDFSKKTNNDSDYDITNSALNELDHYFFFAIGHKCSLILRFAYDGFKGKADMEPSVEMIKNHIAKLSTKINKYQDLIIAIECGFIGPWGEMHTSALGTQDTYNELFTSWLTNVKQIPILSRKPRFVYQYYGYTLDNIDKFDVDNSRLGVFNDGYYGDSLDTGTYVNLSARDEETKFIGKLNNLTGGELIGEPTNNFSYDDIIKEMNLINLTYLNYEWKYDIIQSWKNKTYLNQSFYTYMINHMGFKLYVDDFKCLLDSNNKLSIDINLKNMGFSHITRKLYLELMIDDNGDKTYVKKSITDTNLDINLEEVITSDTDIYLSITDEIGRSYELMNGTYSNETNYLGKVKISN